MLLLLCCAPLAATQSFVAAQGTAADSSSGGVIRGRVVLPNGGFLAEAVRISLQTIRGTDSSIFTDNTGRFEFTRLSPGRYQLLVEPDSRFDTATESVEIIRNQQIALTIVLKEKGDAARAKAAPVSSGELDANVPGKARKEFERAAAASKEHKPEEAIEHLRKAIELYPNYLMARNDLGAQLLETGRLDEAEGELRAALKIDPSAFNPTLNLGIVLVKKNQFTEARAVLEKAISIDARSAAAHLYNGLALTGTSDAERAEKEFVTAHDLGGVEYAIALFHLGQLYMDRGDRNLARQYFQRYLKEAQNPRNLDQVRKLIAMLE